MKFVSNMTMNEKVVFKFDIPQGFEIDAKASNFKTGEIVYKPYEITWEEAVSIWDDNHKGSYFETKKFYFSNTPTSVVAMHEIFIWRSCFRRHPKINREKLKFGKYVIVEGKPVEITDEQRQKGAVIFDSYEEADFVNAMMKKYNNKTYGYSEL